MTSICERFQADFSQFTRSPFVNKLKVFFLELCYILNSTLEISHLQDVQSISSSSVKDLDQILKSVAIAPGAVQSLSKSLAHRIK